MLRAMVLGLLLILTGRAVAQTTYTFVRTGGTTSTGFTGNWLNGIQPPFGVPPVYIPANARDILVADFAGGPSIQEMSISDLEFTIRSFRSDYSTGLNVYAAPINFANFGASNGPMIQHNSSSGHLTLNVPVRALGTTLTVGGFSGGDVIFNGPINTAVLEVGNSFFTGAVLANTANSFVSLDVYSRVRIGADGNVIPNGATINVKPDGAFRLGTFASNQNATPILRIENGGRTEVGAGSTAGYSFGMIDFVGGGVFTDNDNSANFILNLAPGAAIRYFAGQTGGYMTLANGSRVQSNSTVNPTLIDLDSAPNGQASLVIRAPLAAIAGGPGFAKTGPGALQLESHLSTANLRIDAGAVRVPSMSALGSGVVTLAGGTLEYVGLTESSSKSLTFAAGSTSRLSVSTDPFLGASSLSLSTTPSGTGTLVKTGDGVLELSGSTPFAGTVDFQSGTFRSTANLAKFNLNSNTFVVTAGNFTVGVLNAGPGAILNLNGLGLVIDGANDSTFAGTMTGSGLLFKVGTGALNLTSANALRPQVRLSTLNGAIVLHSNGIGYNQSVGMLAGSSSATIDLGPATLTAGGSGFDTTFAGSITGIGSFVKVGHETLTLTGSNSFSGGLNVRSGTLVAPSDSALGAAGGTVSVGSSGTLRLTNSMTTDRTFDLSTGTLTVDIGKILTLNGATVGGGSLVGTFATPTGGGATFVGGRTFTLSNLTLAGNDRFIDFDHGGTMTVASGATATMTRTTVTPSGRMAIAGTVNTSEFVSSGVIQISAGGTINNSAADVYLGGGSRTFIATPGNTTGTLLNLGGRELSVAGGYLVNNGGSLASGGGVRNGTVVVDFGGRVKGAGYFEDVITQNGGVFSPGNSPGTTQVDTARIQPGGTLNIDIDAAGPNGVPPGGVAGGAGLTGYAPGWGLVQATGSLRIYATAGSQQVITLTSQQTGGGNVAGPVSNFDSTRSYQWEILQMQPGSSLFDVSSGGTPIAPATFVYDPSIVQVQTAGTFLNPYAGSFSTVFLPNSIGTYSVYITFTPVPEPVWILVAAGVGAVVWRRVRNVV